MAVNRKNKQPTEGILRTQFLWAMKELLILSTEDTDNEHENLKSCLFAVDEGFELQHWARREVIQKLRSKLPIVVNTGTAALDDAGQLSNEDIIDPEWAEQERAEAEATARGRAELASLLDLDSSTGES